jgi:hypothetical protein
MIRFTGLCFFCLVVIPSFITTSAATWIVDDDGGPGVDFTSIIDAIAAAVPGDLIIVRDGNYQYFNLDKGLSIIADTGHLPSVSGMTYVYHIPSGQRSMLSGLSLHNLFVFDCFGSVVLDDLDIIHYGGSPSIKIEHCYFTSVNRCNLEKTGLAAYTPAVMIRDATAVISECTLIGARGLEAYYGPGYDGGAGLIADDAVVYFQSSSARGGDGGDYIGEEYDPGGDGAPGLWLMNSYLHLFGLGSQEIEGGDGGFSFYGSMGASASAVRTEDSTITYSGVTFISNGKPDFDVDPSNPSTIIPVSPDVPVLILKGSGQLGDYIEPTLHGIPGSSFVLFFAFGNDVHYMLNINTHFLLDPGSFFYLHAGVIPAGSPATFPIHLSPKLSPYQGMSLYLQAYVVTPSDGPYLSTSAGFVLR